MYVPFKRGMVVGAMHAGLRVSRTVSRVYQERFTTQGHPANLTQLWEALESTWASIPVERFRHLGESMQYNYSMLQVLPPKQHFVDELRLF